MRRPLWLAALLPLGLALAACDENSQSNAPATPPPAVQQGTIPAPDGAPVTEAQPQVNSPGTPGPTSSSDGSATTTQPLPGGPTANQP